jgi:HSP20 family molecular chaperone IbpA
MSQNQLANVEPRAAERVAERPAVSPRVDVYEQKDELLLVADLPGVGQDQLKIHIDADRLEIEARPAAARAGTVLVRESRRPDFRRVFVLPDGINREAIAAELRHGVLTLHLPKAAPAKTRRIEVKAG